MRHSPKRTLLMVLLLLTGGAIVNVVVAWGMMSWQEAREESKLNRQPPTNSVQPPREYATYIDAEIAFLIRKLNEPWQAGFPKSSFNTAYFGVDPESEFGKRHSDKVSPAITLEIRHFGRVDRLQLPVAPIWPGFAINTIFYVAILWLLFAAPGFVRRRIRARRGLCPACAYPVASSDVCTECGGVMHARANV